MVGRDALYLLSLCISYMLGLRSRRTLHFGLDRLQRYLINRSKLAGYAIMVDGVGTVGANLHLKHGVGAGAADGFNCNADSGQVLGQTLVIDWDVNKIANPLWRDLHESAFRSWLLAKKPRAHG